MSRKSILFVFTSASKSLVGDTIGWWLSEAAHAYYVLAPHYDIVFASPQGRDPPLDPSSVEHSQDEQSQAFLKDPTVKSLFEDAKPLKDVNHHDYEAVHFIGGRGPVLDLATDETNIQLGNQFYRSGKIMGAVCHGPAALVGVTGEDGKSIFHGKVVTALSNVEDEQVGRTEGLPFFIEDRCQALGATYEKADQPWGVNVVRSGTLITGQNPQSSRAIGEELLKALQAQA
ncbi:class I glutamine amidotransferase-like protein [Russula brevipes]|nr:class I glutamine amidotransferase-like protein [Russula brevipes]